MTIKILIVDDHPMMREALRAAFLGESDLEVLGEATNGIECLELLQTLDPDVILMDLLMSGMDGLETIRQIYSTNKRAKILVLTSLEDEERIVAAIQAGALGYFPKTAPRNYLLEAIRKVADGIPYMPAGITLKLFNGLRGLKTAPAGAGQEPVTIRQKEILALLGEGRTDAEIGQALHLSEATVRSHLHHILQRLGLENRSQAVAYANQQLKSF